MRVLLRYLDGLPEFMERSLRLLQRITAMRGLALLTAMVLSVSMSPAEEKKPETAVSVGDAAPKFEVKDDKGELWKSADHYGKKVVVVYFYPADLTGGCTRQACAFRDQKDDLAKEGIEVVGVSGDSVENHQLFKKVHSLNFPLLADEDGRVAKAFGVPLRDGDTITKNVDGVDKSLKRGVTAARWTFVVGLDGKVLYKNTSVKPDEDSKNVLAAVQQASKK